MTGGDLLLNQTGRCGEDHVGSNRGNNDQVDLLGCDPRALHRSRLPARHPAFDLTQELRERAHAGDRREVRLTHVVERAGVVLEVLRELLEEEKAKSAKPDRVPKVTTTRITLITAPKIREIYRKQNGEKEAKKNATEAKREV